MKMLIISSILLTTTACMTQKTRFYVGTTSQNAEKCIHVCELDEDTESINILNISKGIKGSSYMALSKDKKHLYTTSNELDENAENHNQLIAYKLTNDGTEINLLNKEDSKGRGSCHISLSPGNDFAYVANYRSGDIAALPIAPDGKLLKNTGYVKHNGSGPVTDRQEAAHAHYITTSNDGEYIFVCDLGIDKVMMYQLNNEGQFVVNKNQSFLQMKAGDGPRHIAFHKNNKQLFVLNELSSTVASCLYNAENGTVKIVDTQSTLPEDFEGFTKAAAIRVHPNGKYLYATNRGCNGIAVFEIEESGKIIRRQIYSENMGWLRDINITPSGKYLLAENKDENQIVLLKITADGTLIATNTILEIPEPTCIVFF